MRRACVPSGWLQATSYQRRAPSSPTTIGRRSAGPTRWHSFVSPRFSLSQSVFRYTTWRSDNHVNVTRHLHQPTGGKHRERSRAVQFHRERILRLAFRINFLVLPSCIRAGVGGAFYFCVLTAGGRVRSVRKCGTPDFRVCGKFLAFSPDAVFGTGREAKRRVKA